MSDLLTERESIAVNAYYNSFDYSNRPALAFLALLDAVNKHDAKPDINRAVIDTVSLKQQAENYAFNNAIDSSKRLALYAAFLTGAKAAQDGR